MIEQILIYADWGFAIFLIFLVFIQPSKDNAGNLLTSGNIKESKKFNFLTKLTFVVLLLFMFSSALTVYTNTKIVNKNIVNEYNKNHKGDN